MAWSGSPRGRNLPTGWSSTIQPRILTRDPHCRIHLPGCTLISTEVHHAGDRDDHSDDSLMGVCHHCHSKVTQAQAAAGAAEARARRPRRRPPAPHPGIAPAPPAKPSTTIHPVPPRGVGAGELQITSRVTVDADKNTSSRAVPEDETGAGGPPPD